ncbi:MAG: response regulator transcription factor [Alkalispirochaeta sp.]
MVVSILVVEDEVELNRMISDYLRTRGYTVRQAFDGPSAIREVFRAPPDLVILDLNLPRLGGLEVARTVSEQVSIPMIVVSARGEEEDRLAGFDAGIDDYVVKPFSLPELAMRIAAVLRRTERSRVGENDDRVVAGSLVIDTRRRSVLVGNATAELTAAQYAILLALAREPGRVFTRLQLLQTFQDHAFAGYERTVDVHIGKIRKQIEADPASPRRLITVWGVGYRLEAV